MKIIIKGKLNGLDIEIENEAPDNDKTALVGLVESLVKLGVTGRPVFQGGKFEKKDRPKLCSKWLGKDDAGNSVFCKEEVDPETIKECAAIYANELHPLHGKMFWIDKRTNEKKPHYYCKKHLAELKQLIAPRTPADDFEIP